MKIPVNTIIFKFISSNNSWKNSLLKLQGSLQGKIIGSKYQNTVWVSPTAFLLAACGGGGQSDADDNSITDPVDSSTDTAEANEPSGKLILSSVIQDNGSSSVKVGLATGERGQHGTVSVLSNSQQSIINIDRFKSDERFAGIDGSGLTIAVIDTGMDLDNQAFGLDANNDGISDRIIFARDFTSEADGTADDVEGHGTHVASIIGSSSGDTISVAPGVNFVALQVLNSEGVGTEEDVEDALQWVVQNAESMNIIAINLSLGDGTNHSFTSTHPVYGDELAALHDSLNIAVVAAAGNEYQQYQAEGASSLAVDPNVIAVGAVGGTLATSDDLAFFSQRSIEIPTIFAPGEAIIGATPGGGTAAFSGTSQAAPHVSGIIALAQQLAQRELGRTLSPDELIALIQQSSIDIVDDDNFQDRVINTGNTYQRVDLVQLGEAILSLETDIDENPKSLDDILGSIQTSEVIFVGTSKTSAIDFAGDQDYFHITLTPGEYQFSMNGVIDENDSLDDPVLTLLSSAGAFLSSDDDSGDGLNALLSFEVTSTDNYYLSAGAYGDETGSYVLAARKLSENVGDVGEIIDTAGNIKIDESISGEIDFAGDRDWYAIDLVNDQQYRFELVGETLEDPYLALYNEGGIVIASDDDGGEGLNAQLDFTPSRSAKYYISAESYSLTETGTFILSASESRKISDDYADDTSTIGVLEASGGSIVGEIETAGDRDWVRVDLEAGNTYEFSLRGSEDSEKLHDPVLSLLNSEGEILGMDDDSGENMNSLLSFSAHYNGSYFLSAAAYGDADTGSYLMSSNILASIVDDVPSDPSTTITLSPGDIIFGTIDQPGDFDWYGLNTFSGQTYEFSLVSAGSDPLLDPWLTLYDSEGNFIDYNNDGGSGTSSFLEYYALSDERVYISAEAFDLDSDFGSYELGVSSEWSGSIDVPGNSRTQETIVPGQTISGVIDSPGDADWFALSVQLDQLYQLSMNSAGDEPLQDPWLGIYDASGNFVSYDDDSGNGVNALINYQSDVEGVIYISAEAYDLDLDFGTYELSVFISDLDAGEVEPVTPRETEPNDEFADLLTPGVAIRGQTASYSDDDWFLLSMDNAGTITVSFDDGAGSSYSDHDVSIVDASGNTLAQKSIYSSDTLTAQVATSGNYFVLVENSSETADYILTADISNTVTPRETEPNDEFADLLTPGVAIRGQTASYSDDDWFLLSMDNAGTITVSFDDGAGSSYSDHDVSIVDASGNTLAQKSIYSSDTLTAQVATSGNYFVLVENSSETADYILTADISNTVTPRETEPNDEFADLLTPGVAIRGQTASYSDDDWFLLSMDNAGTITVSFDDGAGSSYSDHDVSIVDASGNTLAQKSIYSSDTLTAQVATSGNYFVLVENSSETADYILTADISNTVTPRETEPNDEFADLLTPGVAIRGQTASYSDDDWFLLSMDNAGTITVSFDDGAGSSYSDHDVSIVDASGNTLAQKSIYSSDTLTAQVATSGNYFVLVENSSETADYILTADISNTVTPRETEPNDEFADLLTPGVAIRGQTASYSDDDWFLLSMDNAGTITVSFDDGAGSSYSDHDVSIVDASGNTLAQKSIYSSDTLTAQVATSGNYFVLVENSSETADYILTADISNTVTPRETEPNDEFADLLTPGVAIRGQTASYSDDDWFLLSMDNAGTITVSFDDGAGSSYSDHDVSIVDASGNTLAQKSIYSSDTLTAQVATSGNYFVLVENSSETADYILTADIS